MVSGDIKQALHPMFHQCLKQAWYAHLGAARIGDQRDQSLLGEDALGPLNNVQIGQAAWLV